MLTTTRFLMFFTTVSALLCWGVSTGCSLTEVRTPTLETQSEKAPTPKAQVDYLRHTVKDIKGKDVALSAFKGNPILIVNTASNCGFTGQYEELQKLHEKYGPKGLKVLGFPSNDFGGQEPGSESEIATFCSTRFAVTFPLFAKIHAKSTPMHPLYKSLTEESPEGVRGAVQWNFTKFLLGRDGQVIARFGSAVDPMGDEITTKIEAALSAQ